MVRVAVLPLTSAELGELSGIYLSALTTVKALLEEDPHGFTQAWRLKGAMNKVLGAPAADGGLGWARINIRGGGAHEGPAKANQTHKERIFKAAVLTVFDVEMQDKGGAVPTARLPGWVYKSVRASASPCDSASQPTLRHPWGACKPIKKKSHPPTQAHSTCCNPVKPHIHPPSPGVCRWCLQVVFAGGVCRWRLQVAFACGVYMWRLRRLQVVFAGGVCRWCLQVVFATFAGGVCRWCLQVVFAGHSRGVGLRVLTIASRAAGQTPPPFPMPAQGGATAEQAVAEQAAAEQASAEPAVVELAGGELAGGAPAAGEPARSAVSRALLALAGGEVSRAAESAGGEPAVAEQACDAGPSASSRAPPEVCTPLLASRR